MTVQSARTLNSDHRRHDRLLVTRYAANDSYPSEKPEAESLVASCSECAQLASDIRLLSQRTSELAAPRRPRDFRITADQAERLRGSWFDRLMRGLAAPGWGTALRPVAGAAFALGLMLVVVGSLPLGSAAPAADMAGGQVTMEQSASGQPEQAPLASAMGGEPAMPAGPPSNRDAAAGDNGTAEEDPEQFSEVYLASPDAAADGGLSGAYGAADAGTFAQSNLSLVYVGFLVALVGGVLLAVVLFARRRYGDALIR